MAGLSDEELRTNTEQPGGVQGGVIETVKRAVIVALKEGLQGTALGNGISGSDVSVEMEYPMVPEYYPGIWVQFSFSEFVSAGVGHELPQHTIENEGTAEERVNWELIQEFQFKGTVSLTIMALTNLERDRIADSVITMLAFSRPPSFVMTDTSRDTRQFRALITALADNPYVSMTIDHDTVTPGGQAMTPGVPWDSEIPGYEDTYSFSILGQFNIVFRNDGTFTLRGVAEDPVLVPAPTRYEWH